MKRLTFLIILIMLTNFISAEYVDIMTRIPFGKNSFEYKTDWDPNEGSAPELNILASHNNLMILYDGKDYFELNMDNKNISKSLTVKYSPPYTGYQIYGNICDGFIYGNCACGYNKKEDLLIIYYKGIKYTIENTVTIFDNGIFSNSSFHCVDDTVYFMTGKKSLVCIQLESNGKYLVRNELETKEFLATGKKEELGVNYFTNKKGNVYRICIGDYSLNKNTDGINYWKKWDDTFQIMNSKYSDKKNLNSFSTNPGFPVYVLKGTDKNGFHYFMRFDSENGRFSNDNPGFFVKFSIAVYNPFDNKLFIYDDFKQNEWNPSRNEDGKPIAQTYFYVSQNGDIYFSDCDAKNNEWLIKKIPNRLYEEKEIYALNIGRINKNHIPLYENPNSSSETLCFNFENDIVCKLDEKGKWIKIQKINGEQGWVESKYINFDIPKSREIINTNKTSTEKDSVQTNVLLNKTMSCNDNLRLRSEEITSSKIITTMKKGTKVKIIKLGKEEAIDGINSNWVQVEVLKGGLDKDGNPIKTGTLGWCYGGYLE